MDAAEGTFASPPVSASMAMASRIWLVFNKASGSNDEEAHDALRKAFAEAELELAGETCFPDDDPPSRAGLDSDGVDTVAVFSGDGSLSSIAAGLAGWSGAVLALPGGTMNMMARRMHGDATAPEIVARLRRGIARRVRPTVIRSRHAVGLTGVLAGPGTAWADVREAMREANLLEFVSSATEAVARSAAGPKVLCLDSDCGREEGYSAITATPQEAGIEGSGYYAATLLDFARHGVALAQKDFRSGPHDFLGMHRTLRIASSDGEPMGLLIDGEPYDGGAEERFELEDSEVDFWVTADAR